MRRCHEAGGGGAAGVLGHIGLTSITFLFYTCMTFCMFFTINNEFYGGVILFTFIFTVHIEGGSVTWILTVQQSDASSIIDDLWLSTKFDYN